MGSVLQQVAIGRHVVTVEEDDLIVLRIMGDLDLEAFGAMLACIAATLARCGRAFLIIDELRPGIIPPEVQRQWIAWNQSHRISGLALFTESLMQHTVASMSLAAIKRLRQDRDMFPWVLTKNEAQARAWMAELRSRVHEFGYN